ncbi:MAG: 16S rRNA (guanine(966)-N(2))-methyltransferase RsmD [Pedosphaera sp.]|nr:16S rRNA (guanine(966)-N(2))-methyltransferase RsmD [Pedosphaera sp.]MSU43105.1 16S rRNA (guanine(966)-N(2))-methyltransferase RsmD [Pedosphaera sp.]
MRITGGQWRGASIAVPAGDAVRPMPEKVRQALFNSLGDWIAGQRVLELFAGTGCLSIECLSRGAVSATCVELSGRHAQFIHRNATAVGATQISVRVQDALVAVRDLASATQTFDFIVADPPYGEKNVGRRSQSWAQRLLDAAELPALLAPGGRLMLGHAKRDQIELVPPWREVKALKHGDTWVRLLAL